MSVKRIYKEVGGLCFNTRNYSVRTTEYRGTYTCQIVDGKCGMRIVAHGTTSEEAYKLAYNSYAAQFPHRI